MGNIIIKTMKRYLSAGFSLLVLGFSLGIAAYYYLYDDYIAPLIRPVHPEQVSRPAAQEPARSFASIVKEVSPSVVNISTTRKASREAVPFTNDPVLDFFSPFRGQEMPRPRKERSLGSGVIVSEDGYIITNYHVIENAEEIRITLYDRTGLEGRVVGIDPKTDIAVIKIERDGLQAIRWGDSDALEVGEFILAIGNPFGLTNTVTMGIISAVGRANVGIADYEDFIQTDAAINPGNSGGPLVNVKGEVVGINTAIFSRSGGYQGIGFAVPSNMARNVFTQLVTKGKVVRGWIGVSIQDLNTELARNFGLRNTNGALVSDVIRNSPAERGGIMRGDVIVAIDNRKIDSVAALRNVVAQSPIGSEVAVKVVRDRKIRDLTVTIAELPREYTEPSPEIFREEIRKEVLGGLTVIELSRDIARQLGLGAGEKGVVIFSIAPGSPADEAGLKKGDVIQEMGGQPVETLRDFNQAIASAGDSSDIVVLINRNGRRFYAVLKAS